MRSGLSRRDAGPVSRATTSRSTGGPSGSCIGKSPTASSTAAVVRLAELLPAPLIVIQHVAPRLSTPSGYLATAVTSASFGMAAAGLLWLLRRPPAVRRP